MTDHFKILVTGGREFRNKSMMRGILDHHRLRKGPLKIAHGGARGADMLASAYCKMFRLHVEEMPYPVDNRIDGPWPLAGINRNIRMLDDFEPDLVLAFKDNLDRTLTRGGTEHMIRTALSAGVQVRFYGGFDG